MMMTQLLKPLVRVLYPSGQVRKVLRGPLANSKFVVQPGMGATFALGGDDYNLSFFVSRIRQGDRVFDVGGNCGQMALLYSRLVGDNGRVISFEPVPQNFELLDRNLKLNKCANVDRRKLAIGKSSGLSMFNFESTRHTQGSLVLDDAASQETTTQQIEVERESLDNILQETQNAPNLIKIDVEGGGGEVIAGAHTLLQDHKPDIYFEMHSSNKSCPEYLALKKLESRYGYQLYTLDGSRILDLVPGWGTPIWCTVGDVQQSRHRQAA